jgi:repressor LexA
MLPRTQRQKEILDYITSFLAKHGHEPSYAQIARRFGVSSKATIAKHISALEKRGFDQTGAWHRVHDRRQHG